MIVYGFRVGSRDFPRRIAGPFVTLEDARKAAYVRRCYGDQTGRVRRVTNDELTQAERDLRSGVLRSGW